MVWIIYWRNWEPPAPQLGNQEVDDIIHDHSARTVGSEPLRCINMHKTTRQIARETGIHHPPVYCIIHQDFQLKCLKKQRAQELTTATVYISQTCCSCCKVE